MSASTSKVFISYRREETAAHAGRLYDAMAAQFGDANVFMDVDLEPGVDFVERITQAVSSCHVLLVVMGRQWATLSNGEAVPRIAQPDDFVRLEVETALRRDDVTVIPVLVGGARMPDPDELPDAVRALARRNALELSDMRWRQDLQRLTDTLRMRLRDVTGIHQVPPPRLEEEAPPRSQSDARLVGEGALVAFAAGLAGRRLKELAIVDPKDADEVARLAIATARGAVTLAVVGAALAVWLTVVRRGTLDQGARRAVLGLIVGALGGALGGALWGARFLPEQDLETGARHLLAEGSSAVSGAFLGALVGGVLVQRRAVGFVTGFAAGWLYALTVFTMSWSVNSLSERVLYGALQAAVVAGLVLAALVALEAARAGSAAGRAEAGLVRPRAP